MAYGEGTRGVVATGQGDSVISRWSSPSLVLFGI